MNKLKSNNFICGVISVIFIGCSLLSVTRCHAQQKNEISDSTLLAVLDHFIDESHLLDKSLRIVKIRLLKFDKKLVVRSAEPTNIGEVKGERIESDYSGFYTFTIEYEVNPLTVEWDLVTYYSIYRDTPVLLLSGIDTFVKRDKRQTAKLKSSLEKYGSNGAVLTQPIIWSVEVRDKEILIDKNGHTRK